MDPTHREHQKETPAMSINQGFDNILANSYVQAVHGNAQEAHDGVRLNNKKDHVSAGQTIGLSENETPSKEDRSGDQSNVVNSTANHDANRQGEGLFTLEFEGRKGGPLTSTKAPQSYQDAVELDQKERARSKAPQDDIVSGRLAGSNWHQSA